MKIPYTIVMDMARTHITSSILISQLDTNSREVNLVMMDNGSPLDLSDVLEVQMKGITEDGSQIYEETAEILLDGEGRRTNVIRYILPEDIADKDHIGMTTFTATLFSAEEVETEDQEDAVTHTQITSPNFYVKVKPQLYDLSERMDYDYWQGSGTDPGSGSEQEDEQGTTVSGGRVYYCTCESAEYAATKVILCNEVIDLQEGTVLIVHMVNGNTLDGGDIEGFDLDGDIYPINADYPELWINVDEHDLLLVYDGEAFRCPEFRTATADQYGLVKASADFDEGDDSDIATLGAVRAVYDMVSELKQRVYYTACNSDEDDPEKVLNLGEIELEAGAIIYVDFTIGNTVPCADLEGITIGEETYPVAEQSPDPWVHSGQHIVTLLFDGEAFSKANLNPALTAFRSASKTGQEGDRVSMSSSTNLTDVIRLEAPFSGIATVSGYINFVHVNPSSNASDLRHAEIRIAGTTVNSATMPQVSGSYNTILSMSAVYPVEAGDIVTISGWQSSGKTAYAGGMLSAFFTES